MFLELRHHCPVNTNVLTCQPACREVPGPLGGGGAVPCCWLSWWSSFSLMPGFGSARWGAQRTWMFWYLPHAPTRDPLAVEVRGWEGKHSRNGPIRQGAPLSLAIRKVWLLLLMKPVYPGPSSPPVVSCA